MTRNQLWVIFAALIAGAVIAFSFTQNYRQGQKAKAALHQAQAWRDSSDLHEARKRVALRRVALLEDSLKKERQRLRIAQATRDSLRRTRAPLPLPPRSGEAVVSRASYDAYVSWCTARLTSEELVSASLERSLSLQVRKNIGLDSALVASERSKQAVDGEVVQLREAVKALQCRLCPPRWVVAVVSIGGTLILFR